jgi:teichoic acid transport system ATP-binding protein
MPIFPQMGLYFQLVNNIGRFDVPIIEAQKKVENKDPFEEKLAYGIVLD